MRLAKPQAGQNGKHGCCSPSSGPAQDLLGLAVQRLSDRSWGLPRAMAGILGRANAFQCTERVLWDRSLGS